MALQPYIPECNLIRDRSLADDVGRAGQIKACDAGLDLFRIHDQLTAGHVGLHTLAGDLPQQSQDGHNRAGSGAAGICEILDPTLKCPLIELIGPGQLVKIHIGPLGEGLVPADCPPQFPEFVFVRGPEIGIGNHCVRKTRIPQLHIGAGIGRAVDLDGMVQLNQGRVIEADTVELRIDPLAGHHTGGCFHGLSLTGQVVFIAVAADAAGPVAAHLTQTSVRIIEQHPVVSALGRRVYDHQAVGSNGEMPLTQGAGKLREILNRKMLFQIVQDDKVISRTVHFPELQIFAPL